jgi:hypothetical protein
MYRLSVVAQEMEMGGLLFRAIPDKKLLSPYVKKQALHSGTHL